MSRFGARTKRSACVNCPFDALARDYRPLMCGMNQALLAGVVRGLGIDGVTARLDPQPGRSCVALK